MTKRIVYLDGERRELLPAMLLGQGGEAEVYDLGDGRVLKWWKPADHPDYVGMPHAQAAATQRLADQPAKLHALPGALPGAVVVPRGLALGKKGAVVGYAMSRITGTALLSYGEPRWRREHPIDGAELVAMLLALHDAIAGLHRAGVVIGDCNDLNVLVDGPRVHLIDVDSYQLPSYPCTMFSERFVDPRLCGPTDLVPVHPHDLDSDWFAFAVMVLRTLLGVGPWGGVHATAKTATARAVARLSVLGAGITYPRAARPIGTLPDAVVAHLRAIFERDVRGVFPRALLEQLHLRTCPTCGDDHARPRCPTCQTLAAAPPVVVHGNLRWQHVAAADVALASREVTSVAGTGIWFDGGALMRAGRLGPERIGDVLARQTRAWVGGKLGIGFYRAGGLAVGFVFRPDHGRLDDRVVMPRLRGQLVDAHAVVGDDRAWLFLSCADAGRLVTTCVVVAADASVVATAALADVGWLEGIAGACAAGPHLFVPTDAGLARIEASTTILQTRLFVETASLVSSVDRLALGGGGLDVIRRREAIRMHLA
ncbi:MAG: hypothetical protein NT062_26165 [Proteobacteria bacterium]|nr:hypothetical protein [Pseudomonadota bacterium]